MRRFLMKQEIVFLAISSALWATGLHGAELPAFRSLRYDEDYRSLEGSSLRDEPLNAIKWMPLGNAGHLSLGGEIRLMGEAYSNEFFSTDPADDNAYLLERYLLHADWWINERVRIFTQLQGAFEQGKPGDGDVNPTDLHQLFLDVGVGDSLTVRAGRQELSYGSERLLGVREGTNNRRAFDALRLIHEAGALQVDAFYGHPVEWDQGAFDDQSVDEVELWGLYATTTAFKGVKLDFYYLGLDKADAEFSQGTADEKRHTFGTRFSGKHGAWDFNHEVIVQTGVFGGGHILAGSLATDHGYTFNALPMRPRVGLKAAIASGDDDAEDGDLNTFNPLFPRGNYFTEASLLGPQNFIDVKPNIAVNPTDDVTLELSADWFWRQSKQDGIYRPSGSVIYEGDGNLPRFVGTDFSLAAEWRMNRNLLVGAAYTHFFAGGFVKESGGADVDYGGVWLTFRF